MSVGTRSPSHMHLPSVLDRDTRIAQSMAQEGDRRTRAARAAAYRGTLAEDKELMAIFERTYGPIRRDARQAMRPVKKQPPVRGRARQHRPPRPPSRGARAPAGGRLQRDLRLGRAQRLWPPTTWTPPGRKLMDILCNYAGLPQVRADSGVRRLQGQGRRSGGGEIPQPLRRLHQGGGDRRHVHREDHPRDRQALPHPGGHLRRPPSSSSFWATVPCGSPPRLFWRKSGPWRRRSGNF